MIGASFVFTLPLDAGLSCLDIYPDAGVLKITGVDVADLVGRPFGFTQGLV